MSDHRADIFSVSIDTNGFSSPFQQSPQVERPEPPGRREAMKWVVFKEIVCQRFDARLDPEWSRTCRKTLDRFTDLCKLASKDVAEVSSLDLEKYIALRKKEATYRGPISPVTINKEVTTLNSLFTYAGPKQRTGNGRENLGLIEDPPFARLLPEDDNEPTAITERQKQMILEVIMSAKTPRVPDVSPSYFWMVAIVLGTVTALRRGALLRLKRPEDFALRELQILDIPAKLSKTRRQHKVPLTQKVVDLIFELKTKPGELLLPWYAEDRHELTIGYFTEVFRKMQRDAGVPEAERIRFKDLRSTAATEIAERFGSLPAKKLLDHSPTSTTMEKHYLAHRVTQVDIKTSEYLTDYIVPEEQKPALRLFDAS